MVRLRGSRSDNVKDADVLRSMSGRGAFVSISPHVEDLVGGEDIAFGETVRVPAASLCRKETVGCTSKPGESICVVVEGASSQAGGLHDSTLGIP